MHHLNVDQLIRNAVGRNSSAESILTVLNRGFNSNFTVRDVNPYVKSFNQAMKSIDPAGKNQEKQAKQLFARLFQELSHTNKRTIPDE
jgi:hypothetical protein